MPLRITIIQLIKTRNKSLWGVGAQKKTDRCSFRHNKDLLAKSRAYYSIEIAGRKGAENLCFDQKKKEEQKEKFLF